MPPPLRRPQPEPDIGAGNVAGVTGSPSRAAPSEEPNRPGDRWGRADAAALAGAAVMLVVTTALAVRGVSSAEAEVFARVNAGPDLLLGPVWVVMQLGTVGLAALVGAATGAALRRPLLALVFSATPVAAWFAARVIKDVVERGRPVAEGLPVTVRATADGGFGFVSGHSAVAFALATVISPYLPRRWRVVPFVLASAVALARPYVGAHLPLDVLGGAALGIAIGVVAHGVAVLVAGRRAPITPR